MRLTLAISPSSPSSFRLSFICSPSEERISQTATMGWPSNSAGLQDRRLGAHPARYNIPILLRTHDCRRSYLLLWVVMRAPLATRSLQCAKTIAGQALSASTPIGFVTIRSYSPGLWQGLPASCLRYFLVIRLHSTCSGQCQARAWCGWSWAVPARSSDPALGTALIIILREELSVHWEHFLILVGVIVILTVTFTPTGLMGILDRLNNRHRASSISRGSAW